MVVQIIIFSLLCYLIGCLNTGYYYIRAVYKEDIRTIGTNVTGAKNVSRVAGKRGFFITFVGDALKGGVVVLISRLLKLENITTLFGILFVIVGHIYPFQLHFHGGKGLSTAVGAFLVLQPLFVVYWIFILLIILLIIRKPTVACSLTLFIIPIVLYITGEAGSIIIFFILYAIIINYACRNNIKEYTEGL